MERSYIRFSSSSGIEESFRDFIFSGDNEVELIFESRGDRLVSWFFRDWFKGDIVLEVVSSDRLRVHEYKHFGCIVVSLDEEGDYVRVRVQSDYYNYRLREIFWY